MMLRLFIFIVVLAMPSLAKADYFFWEDEKSGLTMTFPDTWKMQNNAGPDTIMTIGGPSENAQPQCHVDVRADKRWKALLASHSDPALDPAIDEALNDFMDRKKQAMADAWY